MKKVINLFATQAIFLALVAITSLSLDALAQQPMPLATAATASSSTASAPNPPQAAAPIKVGGLTISGSIRARFESWDWFDVI